MSNKKDKKLKKKSYLKAQNGERSCGGGRGLSFTLCLSVSATEKHK
jgi:hypothetical protein